MPEGNSFCAHSAVGKKGQRRGAHAIPLTVVPCCVVPAAQALPSVGVAIISMAIAVAGLAVGEAPEVGQAVVALSPIHPREAVALACFCITEGIVRALNVALARCKERRRRVTFPWHVLNTGHRLHHSSKPRV